MIRLRQTLSTNDQSPLVKEYREVWNYAGNVYRNAQSDYEEARFWVSEHDAFVNHLSALGHKRLASIKPLPEKSTRFQDLCSDHVSIMHTSPSSHKPPSFSKLKRKGSSRLLNP